MTVAAQQDKSLSDVFGEVIYAYTREMALEDGVLVDVSKVAKEFGIKIPVALTSSVWESYVEWTDEDYKRQGAIQDQEGRLRDVVWMFLLKLKSNLHVGEFTYSLYVVPRKGKCKKARLTQLKAVMGCDEEGNPAITIMLPGED